MFLQVEKNLRWLAQCKRRINLPLDQADRVGLTAFEYGWKSFNIMYSDFSGRIDRDKMYECIETHLNFGDYFCKNKQNLSRFCEVEHRLYMCDSDYNSLDSKLSPQIQKLKDAIENENSSDVPKRLVDCLYTVRNARVHGKLGTGRVYFSYFPRSILELNVCIISGKLGVSAQLVHQEIDRIRNELTRSFNLPNRSSLSDY